MIDFNYLDVDKDIKDILNNYQIDFAFQPIYYKNGSLFGHEALMRPEGKPVKTLIDESKDKDLLHEVEVLSFFGATLAFALRNLKGKLCINSFPSECLSQKEFEEYWRLFENIKKDLVVEMLESADYESWSCRIKEGQLKSKGGIQISIDDFGTGNNDLNRVKQISPNIVKLDRSLISNINSIESIQKMVDQLIYSFHKMGVLVLAEGVETKDEYDYLQTTDVDLYQGYYLAKPN